FSDSIALQPLPLEAARDTFLSIAPRERFETDPSLDVLLEAMDRLPLAVTLLAHVAQDESTLAPLVERWKSERTALLRRIGGRTKNTNIETSFEMSLKSRRMTEEAKKLLSYLAALPGGVALSDASRIVPAVATAAATLRACGLAFEQDGRLRLLAPLREYMNRQYPVAEGDLAKLTSYYIQLINTYGEQLLSPTGAQALTLLTSERANIEAVLKNVATRFRETEIIDAFVYWSDYVRLTHGSTDVIEAALAQEGAHDHDAFWAPVTLRLGVAALMANDLEKAQKYYEEAASSKDENVKTHAIWGLGQLAMERADYAAARIRLTESLELARKLENKNAEANALKWLGDVAYREGKIDEARDTYETALPVYVADEALVGAANCRRQLATIAFKARRYKRAEELATRARGEFHTAGDYNGEAKSCRLLAQIAEKKKRFADAVQLHAEAARLFHLFGDPDGEILSICHAAAAEMRLGDIEGGRNRYATAIARARLLRREDGIPTILLWQAQHEADAQSRLDLLAHARTLAIRLGNENTLKVLDREERRVTRKRAAASGSEDSPPTVT
ncbi:MAG TPA: tetratricopeptide repeat protein, partial [Thermoanaerobaculia bacterium]|nr:tetratricopeptide repeat protein [Thermoanaerobaculia bacterium]